jgi:hypothetical protein
VDLEEVTTEVVRTDQKEQLEIEKKDHTEEITEVVIETREVVTEMKEVVIELREVVISHTVDLSHTEEVPIEKREEVIELKDQDKLKVK